MLGAFGHPEQETTYKNSTILTPSSWDEWLGDMKNVEKNTHILITNWPSTPKGSSAINQQKNA
jgi:hypothetical protein